MAQHDYIIANQSGAAFRSDLNNGLAAIVSQNSGAAQPSTTYAYQWWADTATGLLKIRNAANNAWITIGTLANVNLGLLPQTGGVLSGTLTILNQGNFSSLEIGAGTTTDQSAYIDLAGDTTYNDYGLRIIRANAGANSESQIRHRGTGAFSLITEEAGPIAILTNGVERVEFGTTEVVFNDGGADVDFRVEGDTKANLFKVDAGADTVIIDGLTHPSADGTADQALVTNGSGVLSFASRSRLVQTASQPTTSGLSIDFTSIPSWVKRITVVLNGVSTNGTSIVQIQLGDSGGPETTGYFGTVAAITGANACGIANSSSGFVMLGATDGSLRAGILSIVNIGGNTWVASGTFDSEATSAGFTQGAKELSATLDRIRLTTVNGTDAFDAGAATIIYEG